MERLWHLESRFPKLARGGYEKTSNATGRPPVPGAYNCIAWAAGDPRKRFWWWPHPDAYWPFWIKTREQTIDCFVKTFHSLGYMVCSDSRLERAFEKVALYAIHHSQLQMPPPQSAAEYRDWMPTHMARQLPDGVWTSKLGGSEDISHFTLDALESYGPLRVRDEYGCPVLYMKRFILLSWCVRSIQYLVWKLQSRTGV
jgi:hypothetical protein